MALQLKPFQRLAPHYRAEWTAFARHCLEVMDRAGMLRDPSGKAAVDLACGTGVLAAALAALGYECPTGRFVAGDMRDAVLSLKAALVTCTFHSLNYLKSVAEVGTVFQTVRRSLKPEGNTERNVSRTLFRFEDGAFEEHEQRPFTREEIEKELAASGFRLNRSFDDSQDGPPAAGAYRICYLADI